MAKQKGIIKILGTIDDMNFYRRKGKNIVRKAGGGFSGEAFRNNPNYVTIRKNANDFGKCSTVKKHFNIALEPITSLVRDGDLHSYMMKLFTQLKDFDQVHEKGQKQVYEGIKTKTGKDLLLNFKFTPLCQPMDVLANPNLEVDMDAGQLRISKWNLHENRLPENTTKVVLELSRLHFDFKDMDYGLSLGDTAYLNLTDEISDLELTVELPEVQGTELMLLSAQCFRGVEDEFFDIRTKNAFGFMVVGLR